MTKASQNGMGVVFFSKTERAPNNFFKKIAVRNYESPFTRIVAENKTKVEGERQCDPRRNLSIYFHFALYCSVRYVVGGVSVKNTSGSR